jgi:hypothetical protein
MTPDAPQVTASLELFDANDPAFVNVPGSVTLAEPDFAGLTGTQSRAKLLSAVDGWASTAKDLYQRSIRLNGAFDAAVGTDRPVN